ncbi:MAG TPA: protein-export chaperone SecB [Burkholderiales bacterium]|jgi:preprotein translocase subunit SecB|nr:protein-export chaperone SecB [Burkholderiales bacterium]
MSQQPAPNPGQPVFTIEKLFVKDLSIEVPNAPRIYLEREAPAVEIQMNNAANPLGDGYFEVLLTVTVTAKMGDKSAFLVEVTQGGVFQVRNVPDQEMDVVLGVTCPNILYPYAREVVSDAVVRAGFPPVVLSPINFEAVYQARQQGQAQAAPTH